MRPEDANRERLVQFLRDEDAQRAKRFEWDFGEVLERDECGTVGCAIGAAASLCIIELNTHELPHVNAIALCDVLGLPEKDYRIFVSPSSYAVDYMPEVTASMVADKIEQVAAEAGR